MVMVPNYKELEAPRRGKRTGVYYSESMHPNPRFYKYYWWVFWRGSPVDGERFLTPPYRMNTADAFRLIKELEEANEPHWVYNSQLPRRDPDHTPFDPGSPRWEGVDWAPAYDDDPDETAECSGVTMK